MEQLLFKLNDPLKISPMRERVLLRIRRLREEADEAEEALRRAMEYRDYENYSGAVRNLYKKKYNYYMRRAFGLRGEPEEIEPSLLKCNLRGVVKER